MELSSEQTQIISESIDELTKEVANVDLRLTALCTKLGILSKAIKDSSKKQ